MVPPRSFLLLLQEAQTEGSGTEPRRSLRDHPRSPVPALGTLRVLWVNLASVLRELML